MTMVERIDSVIRNCRESIDIAQSWNDNRPDKSPLDCESERVVLVGALRCRRALIAGDMVAVDLEVATLIVQLERE